MKTIYGFKFQQKETKSNFTKVPNEVFALEINPYFKLILAYLYSKSDDFIHYQSFISEKLGISRMTVSRALKFLTTNGYLVTNDGGKTYFPVIGIYKSSVTNSYNSEKQSVTDSYNPTVTNRTESVTNSAQVSLTVTPRATDSYTTKKTDIQRLINKTEKTPVVEPSPEATVLKGVSEQERSPITPIDMKIKEIVSQMTDETIIKLMTLTPSSQEKVIHQITSEYDLEYIEEIQLKKMIKEKWIKISPSKIKIEEPKTVQSNHIQEVSPAFGGESSAQGILETYEMFDMVEMIKQSK